MARPVRVDELSEHPDSTPRMTRSATEAIARATGTPLQVVQSIFEEEYAALARSARFPQFLNVLAEKHVRSRLRAR